MRVEEADPLESKSLQLGNFLRQSSLGPADLSVHRNSRSSVLLLGNNLSFLQKKKIEITLTISNSNIRGKSNSIL